jgi:hypothetical protein
VLEQFAADGQKLGIWTPPLRRLTLGGRSLTALPYPLADSDELWARLVSCAGFCCTPQKQAMSDRPAVGGYKRRLICRNFLITPLWCVSQLYSSVAYRCAESNPSHIIIAPSRVREIMRASTECSLAGPIRHQ